MTFCEMLNQILTDMEMDQNAIAKHLRISPQYLTDLKLGRRMPSVAIVNRICAWLGRGQIGAREWHVAGAAAHGWKVHGAISALGAEKPTNITAGRDAVLEEAALEAERDIDENGSVWIRPYHEIADAIRAMKVKQ